MNESAPVQSAIPSATVVVLRDGGSGDLEVLMVRRPTRSSDNFSGMWVFPGGKVDDDDRREGDDEVRAAARAAVREVREEVALELALDRLIPLNRWEPEPAPDGGRRFAAWVFVARSPDAEVVVDGVELHEHEWLTPAEVISRHARREIELAPPTWHSLHVLSTHSAVDDALNWALRREPEHFLSRFAVEDGHTVLAWHGDVVKGGEPHHRHRLWMIDGAWRYERNLP